MTPLKKLTAQAMTGYENRVAEMRKQSVDYVKEKQFGVVIKWSGYFNWIKVSKEQMN